MPFCLLFRCSVVALATRQPHRSTAAPRVSCRRTCRRLFITSEDTRSRDGTDSEKEVLSCACALDTLQAGLNGEALFLAFSSVSFVFANAKFTGYAPLAYRTSIIGARRWSMTMPMSVTSHRAKESESVLLRHGWFVKKADETGVGAPT